MNTLHGTNPNQDLRLAFESEIRPLLTPIKDGSGQARGPNMKEGWIKGLSVARFLHNELLSVPPIFLDEIERTLYRSASVYQILFNVLAERSELALHIDGPPYQPRWHYVIESGGVYYERGVPLVMARGNWYGPIRYWRPHSMVNQSDHERIHMVVDFASPVKP